MAAGGGPPSPFPSAAPNAPIKRPLIHFALPLPPSRRHVAASATTSQHLGELHAMLYGRHLLEWGLFFFPASPISDDSLCLGSTCSSACGGLAARRFSPRCTQLSGVCNLEPLGQNERFHLDVLWCERRYLELRRTLQIFTRPVFLVKRLKFAGRLSS